MTSRIGIFLIILWVNQSVLSQNFITEWTLDSAITQLRFNASGTGIINYTWSASPSGNSGSGSFSQVGLGQVLIDGLTTNDNDNFTLTIEPENLNFFQINNGPDKDKLTNVLQWGNVVWTSINKTFEGCSNLNITASDIPNLTLVTNMAEMFRGATAFNSNIGNWEVSNVTNMSGLFWAASYFNQDISDWDVSNVSNMSNMFFSAPSFNQDISGWDVSNVTNMSGMFSLANAFNQFIGNWDVSNVTNMSFMFFGNSFYNRDISSWDVSSVTNMESMFNNNLLFNQPIGNWNVSSVSNMRSMFKNANRFNQDISNWNVSNVSNMAEMFSGARDFDQSLQSWNVSNVSSMFSMFSNALAFNQNLGSWNLRSNVSMLNMLNSSGLDCNNYSATLIGWQFNNPGVTNRNLGASGREYGLSAVNARNILVNSQGWTISGDSAVQQTCDATLSADNMFYNGKGLEIYPNPSTETFTLKFENIYPKVDISVFNINGQVILNQSFETTNLITINLKQGSGVYFINISNGQQSQTQKLIKI